MTARTIDARALALGAVANGVAGLAAATTRDTNGDGLRAAVRVTGNGTFLAFAGPFAVPRAAGRRAWWTYVGAHAAHLLHLAKLARRGDPFSKTSRFGGAAGYAALAALGATGYAQGATPSASVALRTLHHGGEYFLFGLYGFTIGHGFLAKGRHPGYAPLAALWFVAAARGRALWRRS